MTRIYKKNGELTKRAAFQIWWIGFFGERGDDYTTLTIHPINRKNGGGYSKRLGDYDLSISILEAFGIPYETGNDDPRGRRVGKWIKFNVDGNWFDKAWKHARVN